MSRKPFLEVLQERFHTVLTKQLIPGISTGRLVKFIEKCMKIYAELYPDYKKEKRKVDIYKAMDQFMFAMRQYGVSFNPSLFRAKWYESYKLLSKFFVVPRDFIAKMASCEFKKKK